MTLTALNLADARAPIGTVMLIDDQLIDQKLCERIIVRSGLVENFIGFVSAEAALDHIRSNTLPVADVILLDINMPRMNGFEFVQAATEQLGEAWAKTIIVMVTSSLHPKDKALAESMSNIRYYFEKPLSEEHLEIVADAIGQ